MSTTARRMIPLAIAIIAAIAWAIVGLDWHGWVLSWVGASFKALSGAAIGWALARYVLRIDISAIRASAAERGSADEAPTRAMAAGLAGLAMAALVAGMAIAVAVGA